MTTLQILKQGYAMLQFNNDSYWNEFPTDQDDFDALVELGIYVERMDVPRQNMEAEYHGMPMGKLLRLREEWKADPRRFQRKQPHVAETLAILEPIREEKEREYEEAVSAFHASFPIPPEGYFWKREEGGLSWAGHGIFRLWHQKFGSMPAAE
jgi:hypothetical protein